MNCASDLSALVGTYKVDPGRVNSEVKAKKKKTPCVRSEKKVDEMRSWVDPACTISGSPGHSGGPAQNAPTDVLPWRSFAHDFGGTVDSECQRLNRFIWRRRRTLRRQEHGLHLQEACQAKRSPVSANKSSHPFEEQTSSKSQTLWCWSSELSWLEARALGDRHIGFSAEDVGKYLKLLNKGKSRPDGVTAEMSALPNEQMFSSLAFEDAWFSVMVSSRRSQRVPSHQMPHNF